jgi:hypothetical protein
MKVDISKLKNVVRKDGKIEAQCPACASVGHDATGNHLVVYPDGRFGCVANPSDAAHNKQILGLVGVSEGEDQSQRKVTVRPSRVPQSKVIMQIPRRSLDELKGKRREAVELEKGN